MSAEQLSQITADPASLGQVIVADLDDVAIQQAIGDMIAEVVLHTTNMTGFLT